jgi:uncharacterized membrane protein YeaQ/YmgE (transglycosylase-associated protein family)
VLEIIGWIILGIVAGGIASLLVPGRTPLGCIGVVAVGILGALVGGLVFEAVFGDDEGVGWLGSLLIAIVGAAGILMALRLMNKAAA